MSDEGKAWENLFPDPITGEPCVRGEKEDRPTFCIDDIRDALKKSADNVTSFPKVEVDPETLSITVLLSSGNYIARRDLIGRVEWLLDDKDRKTLVGFIVYYPNEFSLTQ